MNFIQLIIIGIAFSGPTAILIGIGRVIVCLYRSARAKRSTFVIFSVLGILALLALLAAIIAVWFLYGVAHTGKDTATYLVVLASTVVPAYIGSFIIWHLSGYFENRLHRDAT